MRLVVTGTGRSGTGYCAELLRAAGVDAGHEDVFTPAAALGGLPTWGQRQADCSWLAVPRLRRPLAGRATTRVVLVVRHPLATARSYLELEILERADVYASVVAAWTPFTMDEPTPVDRALAHWCAWNTAAAAVADEVHRLETLGSEVLGSWLDRLGRSPAEVPAAEAFRAVRAGVNGKADAKRPIAENFWAGARPALQREVQRLALSFGYDDPLLRGLA